MESSDLILLVTQQTNWADEMDLEGFFVIYERVYDKHLEEAFKRIPFTIYVGTNEEIEFDSISEYRSSFTTRVISKEEFNVLEKLFHIKINDNYKYITGRGDLALKEIWEEDE